MDPAKLDIAFAFTNYAGNGGIASTIPELRRWWGEMTPKFFTDERIGRVWDMPEAIVSDTPVTMSRNRCLREAKEHGFDVLVFIDSDNVPDLYKSDKDFFFSSFDFLYKRLLNDVPTVIAAPYCGPPLDPVRGGEENVYVFKWENPETGKLRFPRVVAFGRDESALMSGIHPAAALPTGMCMISIAALECLHPPYFRYEWKDEQESEKGSTEDVYFTRNIGMAGAKRWGTPIVFCNWDVWAGHKKQKTVGKPELLRCDEVADVYAKAVMDGYGTGDAMKYLGFKRDGTIEIPESLEQALEAEELATIEAEEPINETHALRAGIIEGKPTQFDETVVSQEDRESLRVMLDQAFGRSGSKERKLVYVGCPDPGTLDLMATKGQVFAVVNNHDARLPLVLQRFQGDTSVKFVRYDDIDELPYQSWWDDHDADFVFSNDLFFEDDNGTMYPTPSEILQRAIDVLKPNGILCGNGGTGSVAFDIPTVGKYGETSLWGIVRAEYEQAREGNGRKTE